MLGICCIFFLGGQAWAQFDNGSLVGTAHDNTGAAVSGATVTATNTATGIVTSQQTGSDGQWEFPSLRVGSYKVTIVKAGFADAVADVGVQVGTRQRIDLTLTVGAAQQTVQVNGGELQLETDSSQRGQIITRQEALQLPLVNRNYSSLVLLTSGTRQSSIGTGSASLTREGSFNVEGLRSTFNNYLLDGLDNNEYGTSNQGFSNQIIQPSPDSITQFQVVTNNESAEYGRSAGATVNVAFASGTNKIHFDAYEFFRNTSLNAIGYFPPAGGVKPPLHRNQFGGNVGGPLMKDKAFFFIDYEGLRQNRGQLTFSSIPTADMAQRGIFPVDIRDPYCTPGAAQSCIIPAGTAIGSTPYAADLSAAARRIAALFPAPNVPGVATTSTSSNYETVQRLTDNYDKYDARFDIQWNEKSSSFLRVSQYKENATDFQTLPGLLDGNSNGQQRILDQQVALGYTRQIAANQLLDLRLGASYTKGGKYTLSLGQPDGTSFGIPGLPDNNPRVAGGLPTFAPTGYSSFGRQATNPQWQYPFLFNPKVNYTWVKGRHSLKVGYEYQRIHVIDQDVNPIYGRFTYAGKFSAFTPPTGSTLPGATGDYFADFLFGASSKYELTNFLIAHFRQVMHFGYVQDDWKASDKLTLNLGLRYEYGSPYWDKDGDVSNFDPTRQVMLTAVKDGNTYQRSLVEPDKNDFAPRFGFAFAADDKTAIRGGFGISFIHFNRAGSGNELAINAPQVLFVVVPQSTPTAANFRRLDAGFAAGLTDSTNFNPLTDNVTYIPKNYRDSYVENYFLSVQRQLTKNSILDIAYVGNHGLKLLEFANLNQGNPAMLNAAGQYSRPYPAFGDITAALNSSYSNYNSVQVRYEQRMIAGLTLLNSFTYGRTYDNAAGSLEDTNGHYPSPQNIYNLSADYGPSNYDQPLTNVTSFVYALPFGHGQRFASGVNGLTNQVIGGWQVTGINTMTSGQSLTVMYTPAASFANQVSGITADFRGANNYRPNQVPGVSVLAHKAQTSRSYVQYLNNTAGATGSGIVGAFQNPTVGAGGQPFGNSRNGLAYSDPYYNLDFAGEKSFPMPVEGINLQFRGEFYNLLNKTNFSPPAIGLSSGNFGQITSTSPARVIQFGLKLTY